MALEQRMIEPFNERQVSQGVISFGLSSFGYDILLANEFRILRSGALNVVDPKKVPEESFDELRGEVCEIPPLSFVLGRSVEYFRIPRNVLGLCVGKSTYARCGIIVNITPLEPEWEGFITIAIINTNRLTSRVYANEGIAQVLFFESETAPEISYADRKGKYQAQKAVTPPKILI